jgi:hypothetical protein
VTKNLFARAPPCFGRRVKLLVPAAMVVVGRLVVKIIAESVSQDDEKHVVLTPLSGIKVGKTKKDRILSVKHDVLLTVRMVLQ